jgi:hypothetical protein
MWNMLDAMEGYVVGSVIGAIVEPFLMRGKYLETVIM